MRKKIIALLLVVCLMVAGCSSGKENKVINSIPQKNESIRYVEQKSTVPFSSSTTELDYIAEQSVNVILNADGVLEWYTVSRPVKGKYIDKASNAIHNQQQLSPEWLGYKIWRFTQDKQGEWIREAVGESVVDEDRTIKGSRVFYDDNQVLHLVIHYESPNEDGNTEYTLRLFQLEQSNWTEEGKFSYTEEEEEVIEPVNYCVSPSRELIVARANGEIVKFDIVSGDQIDSSTDSRFDLTCAVFQDGSGYCKDDEKNRVVIFDMDTLVESASISLPEKRTQGSEILSVDDQGNMYVLNCLGIYRAKPGEDSFTRLSEADIFYEASVDNLVFLDFCVLDENQMYVYMYDSSTESMDDYFDKIVNVENISDEKK